jgi:hypothetical protein
MTMVLLADRCRVLLADRCRVGEWRGAVGSGCTDRALVHDALLHHTPVHDESQVRGLTGSQIKCLRALARIGGQRPQSREFLAEAGIALPASVKRAVTRLVNLEIVYGPEVDYKFFDPFFKQWVLKEL